MIFLAHFLYLNRRHAGVRPRLAGWWGNNKQTQFDMALAFDPAADAGRMQLGTIHVLSAAPLEGSLETKKAEIATLLTPVREMLDNYRGEVQKSERARVEAYGGLQEQIRSLLTTTESARRESA